MATANFTPPKNASKYFVLYTDGLDNWDFQNLIENITEMILELPKASKTHGREALPVILQDSKQWDETMFEVTLKPVIHHGYYEGATLDYEIEVICHCDEVDFEDFETRDIEDGFSYSNTNEGLVSIFIPKVEQWVNETVKRLSESLELVYSKASDSKMRRLGSFSNGETIYEELV